MHHALVALASADNATSLSPIGLLGLTLAFAGVIVLCVNALRMQVGGKLSVKLWAIGAVLLITGIAVLAAKVYAGK